MQSEMIYGVYLFFLLVGTDLGLLIGFLIGFQTAQNEIPDFDEDWLAYEESRHPSDDPRFTIDEPTKEVK